MPFFRISPKRCFNVESSVTKFCIEYSDFELSLLKLKVAETTSVVSRRASFLG